VFIVKTCEQGAQTTIHCAVSEEAGRETGLYYRYDLGIAVYDRHLIVLQVTLNIAGYDGHLIVLQVRFKFYGL
jgi:hypothetical protein